MREYYLNQVNIREYFITDYEIDLSFCFDIIPGKFVLMNFPYYYYFIDSRILEILDLQKISYEVMNYYSRKIIKVSMSEEAIMYYRLLS